MFAEVEVSSPFDSRFRVIVAVDDFGGISRDGKIPWGRLSDDMRHFREKTLGGVLVMGRGTYESLPGPLDQRTVVVVSRSMERRVSDGLRVVHDVPEAVMGLMFDNRDVWVAGGQDIYQEFLSDGAERDWHPHRRISEILLTHVRGDWKCDRFFPKLDLHRWQEIATPIPMIQADRNGTRYSFHKYVRRVSSW